MGVTYSAVQFLASDGSNVREARSLLYRFSWSSALLLLLYAALLEMQRRRCVGSAEEAASTRWSLPACILTRRAIVTIVLGLLFCADALLSVWAARSMAMSAIFACALSNTLTVTLYSGREVWLLAMLQRTRLGVTTQHLLVAASASIILVKLLTAAALWKVAYSLVSSLYTFPCTSFAPDSSSSSSPLTPFLFQGRPPALDRRPCRACGGAAGRLEQPRGPGRRLLLLARRRQARRRPRAVEYLDSRARAEPGGRREREGRRPVGRRGGGLPPARLASRAAAAHPCRRAAASGGAADGAGGAAERGGVADTATDPASEPADIAPQRVSVTQQCGVRCIISERAVSEHGERERERWRLCLWRGERSPAHLECRS